MIIRNNYYDFFCKRILFISFFFNNELLNVSRFFLRVFVKDTEQKIFSLNFSFLSNKRIIKKNNAVLFNKTLFLLWAICLNKIKLNSFLFPKIRYSTFCLGLFLYSIFFWIERIRLLIFIFKVEIVMLYLYWVIYLNVYIFFLFCTY